MGVVQVLSAEPTVPLTLSSVSARAILHQDVVERLIGAVRQLMHSHCCDPLRTHRAFRIPSVNDAVITRPADRDRDRDREWVNTRTFQPSPRSKASYFTGYQILFDQYSYFLSFKLQSKQSVPMCE